MAHEALDAVTVKGRTRLLGQATRPMTDILSRLMDIMDASTPHVGASTPPALDRAKVHKVACDAYSCILGFRHDAGRRLYDEIRRNGT